MSQSNKINDSKLFDNFKTPKVPKAKTITNYFDNYKDLYKFDKEYFINENDTKLTGFSYVNLLNKGFDIFNNDVNSFYGAYNGNSKFNVEFQKAKENYDYFNEKMKEWNDQVIQDQEQEIQDQEVKEIDQNPDIKKEVNNDSK